MSGNEYPDPGLVSYRLDVVYPYLLEAEFRSAGSPSWRQWLQQHQCTMDYDGPWTAVCPEELESKSLGRWFFREVRALFYDEQLDGEPRGVPGKGRLIPKFHWMTYRDTTNGASRGRSLPVLSHYRLGIVASHSRGSQRHLRIRLLPQGLSLNVKALVSAAGVVFLIFRLACKKGLSLSDGMLLNYLCAHGNPVGKSLVLVPTAGAGAMSRRRHESGAPKDSALLPLSDELEKCLTLWPEDNPDRSPLLEVGRSLPEMLRASLAREMGGVNTYPASHGRLPVSSHFLLPPIGGEGRAKLSEEEASRFDALEGLVARCHRHPSTSEVLPVPLSHLQGPEFRTVHVTGSQRFHVTMEGVHAFGFAETAFDRSQWADRTGKEYLLTYLIALHQAVVIQDLSWRSYTRVDGTRDNEPLYEAFLQYNTEYDFSVVSPQFNVQRLYRTSREVLSVPQTAEEVRSELSGWAENETRKEQEKLNREQKKLNDEQRNLNSLAVLAFLVALATFFLGLNLGYFNADSRVSLFWGGAEEAPGLLFVWLPAILVAAAAFFHGPLRQHLTRVWKMFWKGSGREGDTS